MMIFFILYVVLFVPFLPLMVITGFTQKKVFEDNATLEIDSDFWILLTGVISFAMGYVVFRVAGWTNEIWSKFLELLPFFSNGKGFMSMLQVIPMMLGILIVSIPLTTLVLVAKRSAA